MSRVKIIKDIIKDTTLVPVNVSTNGTTRTNFSPENAHSFLNTKIDKIRNELDNRLSEQEAYDILVGNN